jgi:hypothetical protein
MTRLRRRRGAKGSAWLPEQRPDFMAAAG